MGILRNIRLNLKKKRRKKSALKNLKKAEEEIEKWDGTLTDICFD